MGIELGMAILESRLYLLKLNIFTSRDPCTHTPEMHSYVNRKTYMNVHSSIIHDFQKLETIQMPLTSICGMFIQWNTIQLLLHVQYR